MTTPPSSGFPYWIAVVAALLAFVLARRRAEHRPIALFLGAMVAIDVARLYLRGAFGLDLPGPYTGVRRVAFHLDEAGFLAWPAGLIALVVTLFTGRRPWFVLAAWAGVCVTLIALYPSDLVRGASLQRIYMTAYLGALLAVIVGGLSWGARRLRPQSEHAVVFVIGAIEIARLIPFHGSVYERWQIYAPMTNAVLYGLLAAMQGVFIWSSSRSS